MPLLSQAATREQVDELLMQQAEQLQQLSQLQSQLHTAEEAVMTERERRESEVGDLQDECFTLREDLKMAYKQKTEQVIHRWWKPFLTPHQRFQSRQPTLALVVNRIAEVIYCTEYLIVADLMTDI